MKKQNHSRAAALFIAAAIGLLLVTVAIVQACTDGATSTELAWQADWPSCDQTLIDQYYQLWDLTDDSWNPAGKFDDCNLNRAFAKVLNGIALINFAPNGGAPRTVLGPFHDRLDYINESRATRSDYHGDFYIRYILDGFQSEATSYTGVFDAEDHTDLHCPVFNFPGDAVDETSAVLVHEAWHHWQHAHNYQTSHLNGPQGSCSANGPACDWFYPHAPGSILPDNTLSSDVGGLNETVVVNGVGIYFHSPYQIMAEFDADIATWSLYAPFSVRQEAQSIGNSRLSSNFVNAAAFQIGPPLPFPPFTWNPNN